MGTQKWFKIFFFFLNSHLPALAASLDEDNTHSITAGSHRCLLRNESQVESFSMITCTVLFSCSYSLSVPFKWTSLLVPGHVHKSRMKYCLKYVRLCDTGDCVNKHSNLLPLLRLSEGHSRTCQCSWIQCRDVVFKLLECDFVRQCCKSKIGFC